MGRGDFAFTTLRNFVVATFLLPLAPITEEACPQLSPTLRAGFGAAAEAYGALVPPELATHARMIYDRYLGWPIAF